MVRPIVSSYEIPAHNVRSCSFYNAVIITLNIRRYIIINRAIEQIIINKINILQ